MGVNRSSHLVQLVEMGASVICEDTALGAHDTHLERVPTRSVHECRRVAVRRHRRVSEVAGREVLLPHHGPARAAANHRQ